MAMQDETGTTTLPSGSKDVVEWSTPDDVTMRFSAGDIGARVGAVVFDAIIIVLFLYLLGVLAFYLGLFTGSRVAFVVLLLSFLFARIGYWVWMEWRYMGQTFGKSLAGIQVLKANGDRLTLSAVITRNLLREVEFWLPLTILLLFLNGRPVPPMMMWCFGFLLIPLFSANNRRLGDFVAGTVVVESPEHVELTQDLLDHTDPREQSTSYAFTRDMLDVYGVVQLNALQDVLETQLYWDQNTGTNRNRSTLYDIKDRVVDKIDYPDPVPDEESVPFLRQFYRAMRRHLEGKLASGESIRTEIKEDTDSRDTSQAVDRLARKYRLPKRDAGGDGAS
jgi:uncharacterized RDD family membrane protein YckC